MKKKIRKILVAIRGEIAIRIFRAAVRGVALDRLIIWIYATPWKLWVKSFFPT
jgi:pyruvate carboxylase